MNERGFLLVVEGISDKQFMDCLLQHLGLEEVEVMPIEGGVESLHKIRNEIKKRSDVGTRVAVVIDADRDVAARREKLSAEKKRLELSLDREFLMPNNEDHGCLEDLLVRIAADTHKTLHDCFERYTECVQSLPGEYELPGLKEQVYAYCQALGRQPGNIDYMESDHWNLEAPALDSLKAFLTDFVR